MRRVFLAMLGLLLTASLARAESTTRPASEGGEANPADRHHRMLLSDGPMGGRFGGRPRTDQPSPEEWTDVAKFMKEHSPKRWKMYETAPEGQQSRLRGLIYGAWKNLQRMENDDPEMYNVRVRRLPVEDEIFEIAAQIKKTGGGGTESQRSKLKDQVAKFVDLRLEERRLRVTKLQDALDKEKKKLANAESRREKDVETGTSEIASQEPGALLNDRRDREEGDGPRREPGVTQNADQLPPYQKGKQ